MSRRRRAPRTRLRRPRTAAPASTRSPPPRDLGRSPARPAATRRGRRGRGGRGAAEPGEDARPRDEDGPTTRSSATWTGSSAGLEGDEDADEPDEPDAPEEPRGRTSPTTSRPASSEAEEAPLRGACDARAEPAVGGARGRGGRRREAPPVSTVEAETVALADREQAEEAALAGLQGDARAERRQRWSGSEPPPVAGRRRPATEDGRASRRARLVCGRASWPPPW